MSSRIVDLTAVRESYARLDDIKRNHPELTEAVNANTDTRASNDDKETDAGRLQTIGEVQERVDELERLHPELSRYGHDEASTEAWLDALREADNTDTETQADHAANDDSENNDAS